MTIAAAEELKRRLTDKYVVVQDGVAELRRFQGLTGTVKTVNMSGRALVQFDGPVDIGWYDIDTTYLQVVDQPAPKKAAAHEEKGPAKGAEKSAPAKGADKPAAAKAGGSPLDMIRKQGAAKPEASQPEATGGAKKSPLDMIRQQGAAKVAEKSEAAAPVKVEEAAPAKTESAQAKPPAGMSPLDMIRKQGAAKR
jgi:hypothetical protein